MKEIITKVVLLLLLINIVFINTNMVKAEGMKNVIDGGDAFLMAGQGTNNIDEDKLKETSSIIYNTLLLLGIAVAVIISAILGIKFIMGSVEEKAQIKEALVPFIIGCVVVFGAFGIWKIVVTVANSLTPY